MLTDWPDRIAARLPKGRVARGIITLTSGTVAAQLVTLCAMPIVTRLYTPAQIGTISLFLAFFGFWASTLSLRYEYALLIAEDDAESHFVHRLAMMLVVAMSVLGLPILWGLHYMDVLGFDLLPSWTPFMAVPILLGYGWFMVYRSWALRAGIVKDITQAAIVRSTANALTRVSLGVFSGVPALFAAELVGAWGPTVKLSRVTKHHFSKTKPSRLSATGLLSVARKYKKFPAFETPSAWVDQAALMLPLPMVAALHGPVAAGWFGLARMMVAVPNSQIGRAVADVFQMELARAVVEGDVRRARKLFYKFMRKLALVGLLPLVIVIIFAPPLMPLVFGQAWKEAGYVAAIIAPWMYAALIISPLSRSLSVLQIQEYKLIYDVIAVALLALAFWLAKIWALDFLYLILAISVANLVGYIVYAILLVVVVEIRLNKIS